MKSRAPQSPNEQQVRASRPGEQDIERYLQRFHLAEPPQDLYLRLSTLQDLDERRGSSAERGFWSWQGWGVEAVAASLCLVTWISFGWLGASSSLEGGQWAARSSTKLSSIESALQERSSRLGVSEATMAYVDLQTERHRWAMQRIVAKQARQRMGGF